MRRATGAAAVRGTPVSVVCRSLACGEPAVSERPMALAATGGLLDVTSVRPTPQARWVPATRAHHGALIPTPCSTVLLRRHSKRVSRCCPRPRARHATTRHRMFDGNFAHVLAESCHPDDASGWLRGSPPAAAARCGRCDRARKARPSATCATLEFGPAGADNRIVSCPSCVRLHRKAEAINVGIVRGPGGELLHPGRRIQYVAGMSGWWAALCR